MRIYNSLTRQVEELVPIKKDKVGMYTCGMTVYGYAHIGHGRKYVYDDVLRRALAWSGLDVLHVQNVTDVGHLVSDADEGEDKMEKGARTAGKSVWDIARDYERDFFETMDMLNVLRPSVVCRATEHVGEQIELIKRLSEKGFAYDTPEAVYFDVSRFPRYEGLFGRPGLDQKRVAVRDEVMTGDHKRHPADFALWFKRVGRFSDHQMHWDSPWGDGFPGWHIECSAMAMKYLGESFDVHTGGEDHIPVHHPNEIAQSEGATGKPFAKYWVHHAFLRVDGEKMSKSLENTYRVKDVVEKGFQPAALRYFYLTAHYRTPQNFTWSALAAAQSAYDKLKAFVQGTRSEAQDTRMELSREKLKRLEGMRARFEAAVNDDLSLPTALATVWEIIKSNIPDYDKLDELLEWDRVLGLGLSDVDEEKVPREIVDMGQEREAKRREGKFVEADQIRMEIERKGWKVEDSPLGSKFRHVR